MPYLSKKAISLYLKNGCERQLKLYLYRDKERAAVGLPPRQAARSGLRTVADVGFEFQRHVIDELRAAFGARVRSAPHPTQPDRFSALPLREVLDDARAYHVLVEPRFDVPSALRRTLQLDDARDTVGNALAFADVQPDVLFVLPARFSTTGLSADGRCVPIDAHDTRMQLRVVDVKLSSEPGANYFGEVVYYTLALAAWLHEQRLSHRFVVVPDGAIWPGSYEASHLAAFVRTRPHDETPAALSAALDALERDVERVDFAVYAPRLLHVLQRDVPRALAAPLDALDTHVNYRCMSCEFFGHAWRDRAGQPTWHERHCAPLAARPGKRHLSQVFGLTRGAARVLRDIGVSTVEDLAALLDDDPALNGHALLRAQRHVLTARARSLTRGESGLIEHSGTSAALPKFVELEVFLNFEYDPSTAVTSTFAFRATWTEPVAFVRSDGVTRAEPSRVARRRQWGTRDDGLQVFFVEQRDLHVERARFLEFARALHDLLRWVRGDDAQRRARTRGEQPSRYQVYVWDDAQLRHLSRLISRHFDALMAEPDLHDLAWLFPNAEVMRHADTATRASPITVVAHAVHAHVRVPVAHHYTLADVARHYHPSFVETVASVPALFQDPLSHLVPSERLHEAWDADARYDERREMLLRTSALKAYLLMLLTRRLRADLRDVLSDQAAPFVNARHDVLSGVTDDAQLWHHYQRLNAAMAALDGEVTYALAPHERVARNRSAHLTRLLEPHEVPSALLAVNDHLGLALKVTPDMLVYELSAESRDVNVRSGDLSLLLSPRADSVFLHRRVSTLPGAPRVAKPWQLKLPVGEAGVTQVELLAIDRAQGVVVLRASGITNVPFDPHRWRSEGWLADFTRDVMLDRFDKDFLSRKLRVTLQAIGRPRDVDANGLAARMLGPAADHSLALPTAQVVPAADFLWRAGVTHEQRTFDAARLAEARAELERQGVRLNASQWEAWEAALSRRLSVVWGPPGTGKSQTVSAVVRGAAILARLSRRGLRVLVTANTYTAVDNVLQRVCKDVGDDANVAFRRVQNASRDAPEELRKAVFAPIALNNVTLDRREPSAAASALLDELAAPPQQGVLLVGMPAQQVHNLAYAGLDTREARHALRPWFDLVVIDEASQLDVATSTLVFTKLAPGGAVVLAGDDRQLPPIHAAEKPALIEARLGSVYEFMTRAHDVPTVNLNVNYRSSDAIVRLGHLAGYDAALRAHSPRLALHVPRPMLERPADWPEGFAWTPAWSTLLRPDWPVTCVVYDDETSAQANAFEADAIAALAFVLHRTLASEPLGRVDAEGRERSPRADLYTPERFWEDGLGIVTPHKAQVAKVFDALQRAFRGQRTARGAPLPLSALRSAVDTVERFQGQERDVIFASFGVGDPDLIRAEDAFLFDLRRFNVMASRPRVKLVVFVTRSLLYHLSDDRDVVRDSALLKSVVDGYCDQHESLPLLGRTVTVRYRRW
ncbi:AAA domain-containing protein [Deinococcus yavapaiensis]|uniref:AAA domain-containing protein n=1 Tax=Deinococcus yavapaiensis KR-236 TaxID=694435 RepID=A0A318S8L7_9DEIO|nr:AAA domain-containing protein [Deinococcus yavapaiensis]PYE51972.1 AAA domain-containing protein [Deinococcus yavapaiensis KR-236]